MSRDDDIVYGKVKRYDMKPWLGRSVFRELQSIGYFCCVRVAFGTVKWPNAQDLCPGMLYLNSMLVENLKLSCQLTPGREKMQKKILIMLLVCIVAYLFLTKFVISPAFTVFFRNHDPKTFFQQALSEIWDDSKGQVPYVLGGGGSGISTYSGSKHCFLSFEGDETLCTELLQKYFDHVQRSLQQSQASIHGRSAGNRTPDGFSHFSMTYTNSKCGGIIDVNSHVYDDRIHIDILVYEQKR